MNNLLADAAVQVQWWLRRMGWAKLLVGSALLAAICGQWLWLPFLQAQQQQLQKTLDKTAQALRAPADPRPAAPKPMAERNLIRFYDALGEKSFVEQQVNTLFVVAERAGMSLRQGEYKLAFDKNGGFHTYQATLPVKGTYAQIRQFCEHSLLQIPFAALDEISFKREQIANRNLDARIKLTFYLSDADSVALANENALLAEAMAARAAQENPAPKRSRVIDAKAAAGNAEEAVEEERQ